MKEIKYTSKIICPNCGRKLETRRTDGQIRMNIHCRCKDWSHGHTCIQWIAGAGYHVFDENMNFIPVLDDFIEE